MRQKSIVFLLIIFLIPATVINLHAHSGKARFHVIIDTDCAPDDLRAISMILASPDFEVIAITTSDGLLKPEEGYIKVKSLLRNFGHEGIPVAYGKSVTKNNSFCHSTCISVNWGNETGIIVPEKPSATELIIRELNNEDELVILICLGPLTNISEILSDAKIYPQIESVLWYSNYTQNKSEFNYANDTKAGDFFMNCNIAKYILKTGNSDNFVLDKEYLDRISELNGSYASIISESHKSEQILSKISEKKYKLWDDLVPLFMVHPELFTVNAEVNNHFVQPSIEDAVLIKSSICEILESKHKYENKVFKTFPLLSDFYADDLQPFVNEIISKHGVSELEAGVLTNELHGHLGIYAIIGVKMGIRVRQYYNISVDDVHVISFAGSGPPVSCMNDGLQVSTGGTMGHGLFSISDEEFKRPEATFVFKNKSINLRLKEKYWEMIKYDVKATINKCGNLTPAYWEELRGLAVRYWLEFDRMEIFEIVEM